MGSIFYIHTAFNKFMKLSIILPVYNEAKILESSLLEIEKFLKSMEYDYEIILAEDGSEDGSDRICEEMASGKKRIKYYHSDKRLGRGKALKRAFLKTSGDVLIYFDVDLATELFSLKELVKKIEIGYDISIGSRLIPGSETNRFFLREIASRIYNLLARFLFQTKIKDLQCGFKAFRRTTLPFLLKSKSDDWFWDTETLLLAEKEGMKISEIPVKWKEGKKSRVNVVKDSIIMGLNLIKLKIRININNS